MTLFLQQLGLVRRIPTLKSKVSELPAPLLQTPMAPPGRALELERPAPLRMSCGALGTSYSHLHGVVSVIVSKSKEAWAPVALRCR